jgi:hypothetical protein
VNPQLPEFGAECFPLKHEFWHDLVEYGLKQAQQLSVAEERY